MMVPQVRNKLVVKLQKTPSEAAIQKCIWVSIVSDELILNYEK